MVEIWRILSRSFHQMYTGKFLEYDPWGKEWTDDNPVEKSLQGEWLADGLFGVIFSLTGDLDHNAKQLCLRHYNANAMCDHCPASRNPDDRPHLYNNFGPDAVWMKNIFTILEWRALYNVFLSTGFFGLSGSHNIALSQTNSILFI